MSVLTHLQTTASNLVIKEDEKSGIRTSISTLESRLVSYFDSIEEKFVFGSFDRLTILPRKADENSDVDYMVVFKDGVSYRAQTLMTRLKNFAEAKYSRSEIFQSSPTIVLELNHIKFELAPAYKSWGIYYIPAPASNYANWISTNPKKIKDDLESKNTSNSSQIRPIIRLLKYWNALNDKVYTSYELESNIITQGYWFCTNLKEYFFSAVSNLPSYGLPTYKANKLDKLKKTVEETKRLEKDGYPATAELEIQKVIPAF